MKLRFPVPLQQLPNKEVNRFFGLQFFAGFLILCIWVLHIRKIGEHYFGG